MLIMISMSVLPTMKNTFGTTLQQLWGCLPNATSRQYVWFITLGPQGGESISNKEMIQCFSGRGHNQITTLSWWLGAFQYIWRVTLSTTMLKQPLKGFICWSRGLQQGQYIRMLVWWLPPSNMNLWCSPWIMEATIRSLCLALEPHILSP